MVYRSTDADAGELGCVVGTPLGEELVRIADTGSPSSQFFAIIRRNDAEFCVEPAHDLELAERTCLAAGVRAAALIRIDIDEIVMLVSFGGDSGWEAECVLNYVADEDEGIETSRPHVEGRSVVWRDVVIAAIEKQLAGNGAIRVGELGDYRDLTSDVDHA